MVTRKEKRKKINSGQGPSGLIDRDKKLINPWARGPNVTINQTKVQGNISLINVTFTKINGLDNKTLAKINRISHTYIPSFALPFVNGRLRLFSIITTKLHVSPKLFITSQSLGLLHLVEAKRSVVKLIKSLQLKR